MDKSELPFLSASQLSRLIASREVSPVDATEAYLDRIDSLDFKFNAYLTVTRDLAMQAAQEAEREIAAGNHRGPMHGVPVAVKDQFHSAGVRTTGGSRILADFVPDEDATVIANLKQAGAVLLGKTNLTEFAITGFSHRFSTPRNPWDLNAYAAVQAVVQEPPPGHIYAPPRWARTPAAQSGFRLRGADWWACGPRGDW